MKSKKSILIVLALMLAACLSVAALAENTAEAPANGAAADAAKAAIEEAQAAADAAQAENTALTEALEAYGKAKTESRKLAALTSLKEELDGYVAAGTLTQEQADLILNYCADQLTQQQNSTCTGFGRGGRGGKGGRGMNNGMNPGTDTNSQNNGFGGKHGRFGNTAPNLPQAPQQAPEAPAEQNADNT